MLGDKESLGWWDIRVASSKFVAHCHDSVAIATFLFTKYAVSQACCAKIACRQMMNYAGTAIGL
jgi:hypothetical protein